MARYTKQIRIELQVQIDHKWIPFSIFENGKYKDEITEWIEYASGQQCHDTELMMLAEALGTNIRELDLINGIYFQANYNKDCDTTITIHVADSDRCIKQVARGGFISKHHKPELAHVINV